MREVHGNVAIVEGPYGYRQIGPGDMLPGAGRVERIERRGRDWAVVTNQGTINSAIGGYRARWVGGMNGMVGRRLLTAGKRAEARSQLLRLRKADAQSLQARGKDARRKRRRRSRRGRRSKRLVAQMRQALDIGEGRRLAQRNRQSQQAARAKRGGGDFGQTRDRAASIRGGSAKATRPPRLTQAPAAVASASPTAP